MWLAKWSTILWREPLSAAKHTRPPNMPASWHSSSSNLPQSPFTIRKRVAPGTSGFFLYYCLYDKTNFNSREKQQQKSLRIKKEALMLSSAAVQRHDAFRRFSHTVFAKVVLSVSDDFSRCPSVLMFMCVLRVVGKCNCPHRWTFFLKSEDQTHLIYFVSSVILLFLFLLFLFVPIVAIVLSCLCLLLPIKQWREIDGDERNKKGKKATWGIGRGNVTMLWSKSRMTERQKLTHFPTVTWYWWFRAFDNKLDLAKQLFAFLKSIHDTT